MPLDARDRTALPVILSQVWVSVMPEWWSSPGLSLEGAPGGPRAGVMSQVSAFPHLRLRWTGFTWRMKPTQSDGPGTLSQPSHPARRRWQ
jgi:hypothetical protein